MAQFETVFFPENNEVPSEKSTLLKTIKVEKPDFFLESIDDFSQENSQNVRDSSKTIVKVEESEFSPDSIDFTPEYSENGTDSSIKVEKPDFLSESVDLPLEDLLEIVKEEKPDIEGTDSMQEDMENRNDSSETDFICKCGKNLLNENLFEEHVKYCPVKEVITCPYEDCGRTYIHRQNLNHHIRANHENLIFACKFCPKLLRTKVGIDRHMSQMHKQRDDKENEKKLKEKEKNKKSTSKKVTSLAMKLDKRRDKLSVQRRPRFDHEKA